MLPLSSPKNKQRTFQKFEPMTDLPTTLYVGLTLTSNDVINATIYLGACLMAAFAIVERSMLTTNTTLMPVMMMS